jgi:chemotaxis protein histidine kinase CheA
MKTVRRKHNRRGTKRRDKRYHRTKKLYQYGGMPKSQAPKSSTQRSKKGRNDRGYRAEDQFVEELAHMIGDLELIPRHAEHQRLHPQHPHDIPISLSSKLVGDYSVKSVANKTSGQKSYHICGGDACVFTDNLRDTTNPLIMALVIRHEEELKTQKAHKDRTVSTETYTIPLHKYTEALYGRMSEDQMQTIFERLKHLKEAYTSKDENISRIARVEIDEINVKLREAGARLKLAPKAANVAKKRYARLQTVIDLDKNSPRFKKMATRVPTGFFKISDETKKGEGMSFGEAAEASRNSTAPSAASRAPKAPSAASRAPRASSAASRKSSASKRSSSAIRVSDLNKDVYLVPRTGIGKRRLAPIAE